MVIKFFIGNKNYKNTENNRTNEKKLMIQIKIHMIIIDSNSEIIIMHTIIQMNTIIIMKMLLPMKILMKIIIIMKM